MVLLFQCRVGCHVSCYRLNDVIDSAVLDMLGWVGAILNRGKSERGGGKTEQIQFSHQRNNIYCLFECRRIYDGLMQSWTKIFSLEYGLLHFWGIYWGPVQNCLLFFGGALKMYFKKESWVLFSTEPLSQQFRYVKYWISTF